MWQTNMYYNAEQSQALRELQKIDNKVKEELEKDNVDTKKVYNLRFQQLMKGIYMTQAPIETLL